MRDLPLLRAWRPMPAESTFVDRLRAWPAVGEAERHRAALLHRDTWWFQRGAHRASQEVLDHEIVWPCDPDEESVLALEWKIWGFLQLIKGALDALAREINFVYWHRDPQHRLFPPTERARWVTFYTVRERLVQLEDFREDPLVRLLWARTRAETADAAYRTMSHLAAASLSAPRLVGRVVPRDPQRVGARLRVREAQVFIPDDPRLWPFTYERGFEVNALVPVFLRWLEVFTEEVYDILAQSMGEGAP